MLIASVDSKDMKAASSFFVFLLTLHEVAISSETDSLCVGIVEPVDVLTAKGSRNGIIAGPPDEISALVGSTVDVCVVAANFCSCSLVIVDGSANFCFPYTNNGLLLANYTFTNIANDHTVMFVFKCNESFEYSNSSKISVQEVRVSSITVTQECEGVLIEWSSPATTYCVIVTCDGRLYLNTTTSFNSIFLSLDEFAGHINCIAYVSAITGVGLGPEREILIAFYTNPVDSIISQDFWIQQQDDGAGIVYSLTTVDSHCASKLPTHVIITIDDIDYVKVVNFSAIFSSLAGDSVETVIIATLPKHLPLTEIVITASNPEGSINVTKSYSTYETLNFTFEQTSVEGQVELGCIFAEGSTGYGCLIEIQGQRNVSIIRNGLGGTKEYNISKPGKYVMTVFDLDVETFGPVTKDTVTVVEWPSYHPIVPVEPPSGLTVAIASGTVAGAILVLVCITILICYFLCHRDRSSNARDAKVTTNGDRPQADDTRVKAF